MSPHKAPAEREKKQRKRHKKTPRPRSWRNLRLAQPICDYLSDGVKRSQKQIYLTFWQQIPSNIAWRCYLVDTITEAQMSRLSHIPDEFKLACGRKRYIRNELNRLVGRGILHFDAGKDWERLYWMEV